VVVVEREEGTPLKVLMPQVLRVERELMVAGLVERAARLPGRMERMDQNPVEAAAVEVRTSQATSLVVEAGLPTSR
jgi:hypothetical protein